jgi:hypothetical protein
VVELIEAVGLWLAKRWGEYFAAVATALFLPIEIYELTEHATKFKIATFALNVLAVVYLVWTKRLFGVRGGGKAYEAELTSESLLHEAGPGAGTGTAGTATITVTTLPPTVTEPTVQIPLAEPPENIVQA